MEQDDPDFEALFHPANNIHCSDIISFHLPAKEQSRSVYIISDLDLEIGVTITDADGARPATGACVAPADNVLHTAFESVEIGINNCSITESDNTYPYRSFLSAYFESTDATRRSVMTGAGLYMDVAGDAPERGPDMNNEGFVSRRNEFIGADGEFKTENTYFIGKLNTDFKNTNTYLPPGVSVNIRLVQSKDSFRLARGKNPDDTHNYKLNINEALLFVKTGVLKEHVYRDLITKRQNDEDTIVHYRGVRVTHRFIIPKQTSFEISDIFEGSTPLRALITFVRSSAVRGRYGQNPYYLAHSFEDVESFNEEPFYDEADDPDKDFWLTDLRLKINGRDVDQLDSKQSKTEATRDFFRLYEASGWLGSGETCGINKRDFENGFYAKVYDLSSVEGGRYSIKGEFNQQSQYELAMICMFEFKKAIKISSCGGVSVMDRKNGMEEAWNTYIM